MSVDLIIPTFNRSELLLCALDSVLRAKQQVSFDINVFIIDNNSKDDTRSVVEKFAELNDGIKITYCFEPRQGVAFARNCGLQQASGHYLVYMDDEQEMDSNYFKTLEPILDADNIDCAGGKIIYQECSDIPNWLMPLISSFGCLDYGDEDYDIDGTAGLLKEGNILLKRESLLDVGGFNTSLGRVGDELLAGEGDDVQIRMLNRGMRVRYYAKLVQYNRLLPIKLEKDYWRKHAVGCGKTDYIRHKDGWMNARRWFGMPRSLYIELIKDCSLYFLSLFSLKEANIFRNELEVLRTIGVMLQSRY
jgi:glycosyltransferase involved in cell wall biosynthesis